MSTPVFSLLECPSCEYDCVAADTRRRPVYYPLCATDNMRAVALKTLRPAVARDERFDDRVA